MNSRTKEEMRLRKLTSTISSMKTVSRKVPAGLAQDMLQVALAAGCLALMLSLPTSATNAHLHPHSQFKQPQSGHQHDSTPGHQGAGHHEPASAPAAPVQAPVQQPAGAPAAAGPIGSGSGAGKIIAPMAAGALMGAAIGGGAASKRTQRHTEGETIVVGPEAEKIIVDLSHPLHNGTLHWPKVKDFQYTTAIDGELKGPKGDSFYLKSDSISTAIHSGTHLDAPLHFSKSGWSVDQIPLQRLIDVPVSVIDVSEKVKATRSYSFLKADFVDAATNASLVRPKSVVLVYTGLSDLYDQGEKAYLGTDTRNISEMRIPGFSGEAAAYLVEQGVYGVGLDAPSADSSERHGMDESLDPVAHVLFNSNNIYILENVSGKLKELLNAPAVRLTIAPLPIVNGSGSPVRLVAVVGHDECHCHAQNSASPILHGGYPILSMLVALLLCLGVLLV